MAEADEAAVPVNVGFLGGDGAVLEADVAAQGVDEVVKIGLEVVVEGLEPGGSSHDGEMRADLDRLTRKSAMVRLQRAGLIGESPP